MVIAISSPLQSRRTGCADVALTNLGTIMGIIPTLGCPMKMFQAADVLQLAGLTRSQLREWSGRSRREILASDIQAGGPGRHALYSWQSVLSLRVLKFLHDSYAVEVGAWSPAINDLRDKLGEIAFPALWGSAAYFPTRNNAEIICGEIGSLAINGVLVHLGPHLLIIATELSIAPPDQLPLFRAMAVGR